MSKMKSVYTDDILLMLCESVVSVLSSASGNPLNFSPMVQKISKTCLKPDLGCFVLFDGGFSGLVVINFSASAAMEIYQQYLLNMGMPESELASQHTSDDVSNVLGELMNQIVGGFTGKVGEELQTSINQNQPKMMTINKEVVVSINTNLDRPQARRVTFRTAANNIFYLEFAVDKTEFVQLQEFQRHTTLNPDEIIEQTNKAASNQPGNAVADAAVDAALLEELGI